jgi:hypothetical protein
VIEYRAKAILQPRILPPGAPLITGRESIKKFWSDLYQERTRAPPPWNREPLRAAVCHFETLRTGFGAFRNAPVPSNKEIPGLAILSYAVLQLPAG